mmetsp:Transcript_12961/g.21284  ORF Transcript_12961/g.21284 Transcript_12961/m.21284 type:complete len:230 (-) Transcript_12961:385-1074(-)
MRSTRIWPSSSPSWRPVAARAPCSSRARCPCSRRLWGAWWPTCAAPRAGAPRSRTPAAAAAAALWALSSTAASTLGCHSKIEFSCSATMESTIERTSGFPRRFLVCPSNSGSGTFTLIMAVRPSRTKSPPRFASPSLSLPALRPAAFTVRVTQALRPSRWLPPSFVLIPLAKLMSMSEYMSRDQRRQASTSTPALVPTAFTRPSPGESVLRGCLSSHSRSRNSSRPPLW